MVGGTAFHGVGPETAKHRCPNLVVLERGTAISPCGAERRCLRLTEADTGVTMHLGEVGSAVKWMAVQLFGVVMIVSR